VVVFSGENAFLFWVGFLSLGVPQNGKEIPCGVEILCPLGLGGGVGVADGGEETGLLWRGHPELPMFWVATMEMLLGFPGEQEFIKSYKEGRSCLLPGEAATKMAGS
jgi:hypothetical protein